MREIRIFNHSWHLAHQYELAKIPETRWTWLEQCRRPYSKGVRGDFAKKFNIDRVPFYEKGKYDLALLHLDQQCLVEQLWLAGKGSLYRELNEVITDIPKIVIMHGTPYYPEEFFCDITKENHEKMGYTEDQVGMSSKLIEECKKIIGNNVMVTNSKTAAKQWSHGIPIWHGLDRDEWRDLPKEPRAVTFVSPGGLDRYYDRLFLNTVKEKLQDTDTIHCHIAVDTVFKRWDDYRNFLGRSLIYFNPTRQSPMPRARTEAMFSGCCVISTANQDAETFLKNGENAIITRRNPDYVAKVIQGLIKNYGEAIRIGQNGKKTAYELFDGERYRKQWRKLMEDIISYHKKHGTTKNFKI